MSAEYDLRMEIRKNEIEIAKLSDRQKSLTETLARMLCPLSVGEVVECFAYSHRGKRCRVFAIKPYDEWSNDGRKWTWRAIAVVFKKDGSDSAFSVELRDGQFKKIGG